MAEGPANCAGKDRDPSYSENAGALLSHSFTPVPSRSLLALHIPVSVPIRILVPAPIYVPLPVPVAAYCCSLQLAQKKENKATYALVQEKALRITGANKLQAQVQHEKAQEQAHKAVMKELQEQCAKVVQDNKQWKV